MDVNRELDTRGLNCPLPILKAKKAITALPVGGTLEVLATDAMMLGLYHLYLGKVGHELIEQSTEGNVFRFVLKRKA